MIQAVMAFLESTIGMRAELLDERHIQHVLEQATGASGLQNPEEYWRLIHAGQVPPKALVERVVVRETWFFRDDTSFGILRDRARAWSSRPLRVLSLPCASGEEALSIAMTLLDAGLPAERVVVDAVDISESALDRARLAIYEESSFRGGVGAWRERYFERVEAGWKAKPELVRVVRFGQGNILDPGLRENLGCYDFVFCRNLLIYLNDTARGLVADLVTKVLEPQGLLFVGAAEVPVVCRQGFDVVASSGVLARVQKGADTSSKRGAVHANPGKRDARSVPQRRDDRPSGPRLDKRVPSSRHGIAGWCEPGRNGEGNVASSLSGTTSSESRHDHVHASSNADAASCEELLVRARTQADGGHLEEALVLCQRILRRGPHAQAYALAGVVHHARHRWDDAEAHFRKALYLHPTHCEVLVHMSLLCEARGDLVQAAAFQARAERAGACLPKNETEKGGSRR